MPNEYINQIQVGTTTYDIQDNIARENIQSLSTSLSTMAFIGDAPYDNKDYGRKNGEWIEIVKGEGSNIDFSIIAESFTTAVSYSTNDYVIYEDELYRFTNNHNAGVWTTTDIIKVNVTNEISNRKHIIQTEYDSETNTIEFLDTISNGGSGGGSATWGSITGTLINQTDLNTALANKQSTLIFDSTPTENSINPVTSNGIYTALSTKQEILTFDSTPSLSSTNPVISEGIYLALADKVSISTLGAMALINDAPSDNKEYVRKNGNWTEASGGGGGNGLPSGGIIGQILAKKSDTDGDVGWYFIHKLPTDKWYLPTGIQESQVIAAYQFIGRSSEAEALININDGTKYTLLKHLGTETWNAATGFIIPGTKAAGLYSTELGSLYPSVLSAAFGFSGADILTSNKLGPGIFLNTYRILSLRGGTAGSTYTNAPCINRTDLNTNNSYKAGQLYDKGVLSGIWSSPSKIYIDGEELSLVTASNFDNDSNLHGNMAFAIQNGWNNPTGCNVTALVFYSTILNAEQHIELSYNIRTLGGIN